MIFSLILQDIFSAKRFLIDKKNKLILTIVVAYVKECFSAIRKYNA